MKETRESKIRQATKSIRKSILRKYNSLMKNHNHLPEIIMLWKWDITILSNPTLCIFKALHSDKHIIPQYCFAHSRFLISAFLFFCLLRLFDIGITVACWSCSNITIFFKSEVKEFAVWVAAITSYLKGWNHSKFWKFFSVSWIFLFSKITASLSPILFCWQSIVI